MTDIILATHFGDLLLLSTNLFLNILPQIHPQTLKLILFFMLNYNFSSLITEMVVLDHTWLSNKNNCSTHHFYIISKCGITCVMK
jgi:hypothetical protein